MQQLKITNTKKLWLIFFVFLAVRLVFIKLLGADNFQLLPDTGRYNEQSDGILHGNFNLTEKWFITAPLYSYLQALVKLVAGSWWMVALTGVQLVLSSLSGVYLYKTAKLLFTERIALITAAIYCIFPLTLWWVHTFTQDAPFQYLLIFSVYFLLKAIHRNSIPTLLIAAVLFSLTFLTKSHILLFSLFIPLIIWFNLKQNIKRRLLFIVVYSTVCLLFTLPYGIYNYRINGVYTLSSTGQGVLFLVGHNDDVYNIVVNPAGYGTAEQQRALQMDSYAIWRKIGDTVVRLNQKQKQDLYFNEGLKWCRQNPQKAAKLVMHNLYYFLLPGVNYHTYPFKQWLFAFMLSFPLYLLAYTGMYKALRKNWRRHLWVLGLFAVMVFFSTFYYVQNRFRTITIEPFYIIYAAYMLDCIYTWLRQRKKNIPAAAESV
jgi:4-amino-4-deoxy-L-arabinose transferase-like glycosyltransferase